MKYPPWTFLQVIPFINFYFAASPRVSPTTVPSLTSPASLSSSGFPPFMPSPAIFSSSFGPASLVSPAAAAAVSAAVSAASGGGPPHHQHPPYSHPLPLNFANNGLKYESSKLETKFEPNLSAQQQLQKSLVEQEQVAKQYLASVQQHQQQNSRATPSPSSMD